MKILIKLFILIFLNHIILFYILRSATAGSDSSVSAPLSYFPFPTSENSTNKIANYAVMDGGFYFEDSGTTCSFASLFPVSQYVNMKGGKLYLNRSLYFDETFVLGGVGKIEGNGYGIVVPGEVDFFEIPSLTDIGGVLDRIVHQSMYRAFAVSWSFDDQYIAGGSVSTTYNEIEVYYLYDDTVTLTASADLGVAVYSVRWHPNSHYLAIGANASSGDDLIIYYLNTSNGSFTKTDGKDLAARASAVAWSYDGQYIAVATSTDVLYVYSFSNGILSAAPIDSISLAAGTFVFYDALDWKSTSDYIVVGGWSTGTLYVYSFDGLSLVLDDSFASGRVADVRWKEGTSFIAVALYNATDLLQIYEHSPGSLVQKITIPGTDSFLSLDWTVLGNRLVMSKYFGSGDRLLVYYFDPINNVLSLIDSSDETSSFYSSRFSHDGRYIASSDYIGSYLNIYEFDNGVSMNFKDVSMVLNCDTYITKDIIFQGNSNINGLGKAIVFNEDGTIKIAQNSELTIQNIDLLGLTTSNLRCEANSSSLILKNCNLFLTNDFEFEKGSILFGSDVLISGTTKFIYSTAMGSTIDLYSTLYINNGVTFSYAPKIANRDLLYMTDKTSWLFLDSCTLMSTQTGIRLTRGRLFLDNQVTFSSQGNAVSEAICFGDGGPDNDLDVQVLAGAQVNVYGRLEYDNSY